MFRGRPGLAYRDVEILDKIARMKVAADTLSPPLVAL